MKFRVLIAIIVGCTGNAFAAPACLSSSSDADGDGWGYENDTSCQVTPGTSYTRSIYDPVLEAEIALERQQWEWSDFVDKTISCNSYGADRSTNPKQWIANEDEAPTTAFFGSDGSWSSSSGTTRTWRLENGLIVPNYPIPYAQDSDAIFSPYAVIDNNSIVLYTQNHHDYHSRVGTNLPGNTRFGKTVCDVAPTGGATPPIVNVCIDTDGDGWGWDGADSCQIPASESNPPITLPTSACIDTDGDGWGWDGSAPCEIESLSIGTLAESAFECRNPSDPSFQDLYIFVSNNLAFRVDEDRNVTTTTWSISNSVVSVEGLITFTVDGMRLVARNAVCEAQN